MRLLLDSSILLQAMTDPERLSEAVRGIIEASDVFASAASLWEIAIKSEMGGANVNPEDLLGMIEPAGFQLLPIDGRHAVRAATLLPLTRDPFDRLLVAQAQLEQMRLLTCTENLVAYGPAVCLIGRMA